MSPASPPAGAQKTMLGNGLLIVYSAGGQQAGDPFVVHVENTDLDNRLQVDLDFSGSINLQVKGSSSLKVHVVVEPAMAMRAAELSPSRPKGYSLSWTVGWKQLPPDPHVQEKRLGAQREHIGTRMAEMTGLHYKLIDEGIDPFNKHNVRKALEDDGIEASSWIDLFFAPVARSIGGEIGASKAWRRALDFCDDKSTEFDEADNLGVFFQAVSANDIVQGELGNCWFMCSLASLVEFPETIDRLFLTAWPKSKALGRPMFDIHGVYELRFCMHGQWMNVQLDDYFPCKSPTAGPVFSRANGPELWVLLIEKAYAKLQGSYFNCRLGLPNEGLMDLTGAPTLRLRFDDYDVSFDDLWSWDRNSCVVCASTPGTDTLTEGSGPRKAHGLVPGHAYTVIQVRRVNHGPFKGAQVLQIRNPWGKFEWGGRWSDNSREMRACRAELEDDGIETNDGDDENDGMFWMAFEDFKRLFISVSVCAVHVLQPGSTLANPKQLSCLPETRDLPKSDGSTARYVPPRLSRRASAISLRMTPHLWNESRVKSLFETCSEGERPGHEVSFRLRPAHCFHLHVPEPDDAEELNEALMFTLSQVDDRSPLAPGYMDVGLVAFKIEGGGRLSEVGYQAGGALRNVMLETYLSTGEYIIVPITGGVRAVPPESAFEVGADPYRPEPHCPISGGVYYALRRIFFSLDHDLDGHLGLADLQLPAAQPFVEACKIDLLSSPKQPMQPGCLIKLADYAKTGGISIETLSFLLLRAWGAHGKEWPALFTAMGYTKALQPVHAALPFVLAMHASQPIKMRRCGMPADIYDRVLCAYCKKHGHQQRLGSASVYALSTGSGAVFIGENTGTAPVVVSVDCTGSTNVAGDGGELRGSKGILPPVPGSRGGHVPEILLAITQRNVDDAYSWTYRCHTDAISKMGGAGKAAPAVPLGMVLQHLVFPETAPLEEQALELAAGEHAAQADASLASLDKSVMVLNAEYERADDGKIRPLQKTLPARALGRAKSTEQEAPPAEWYRAYVEAPSQLACSHYHSVAVGKDGAVSSWGRGPLGVLGHGSEADEVTPKRLRALDGEQVVTVAAGPYNSAAVTADGKCLVWGWQPLSTLEEGIIDETFSTVPVHIPIPITMTRRVIGVSCGCFALCTWDADGRVYTWGRGDSGQLGHGTMDSFALPRPIEALSGVAIDQCTFGGVVEGDEQAHTGFLLLASTSGALFSCGNPAGGRLGRAYTTDADDEFYMVGGRMAEMGTLAPVHHALPGQVLGDLYNEHDGSAIPVARVSAADGHAAVLSDTGQLFIWGQSQAWALGAELADMFSNEVEEPTHVAEAPPLVDIMCSAHVTVGLTAKGEAILLGGGLGTDALPRKAQLPGPALAVYGGGYFLAVLVDLNKRGTALELPVKVLGPRGSLQHEQEESARMLAKSGLPTELADSLDPTIAQLLLAEVGRVPPEQIRHELRLLRDLLRAEKAKLHSIVHKGEEGELPPSVGTWTDRPGTRAGTRADEYERRGYVRELSARRQPEGRYMAVVAETSKMNPQSGLFEPSNIEHERSWPRSYANKGGIL